MPTKVKALVILFGLLFVLASPSLAQTAPPSFSKSFTPDTIGVGNVSTLTFYIYNEDQVNSVGDMAFTDILPAGVMTIATPASATSDCGGTLTAPDGGTTISLSGGQLGANSGCTISVNVTGSTPGVHTNTSGDLTSSAGNSGPAIGNLTVDETRLGFSKSFVPDPINFGGTSTLTFIIDNTGNEAAVDYLNLTDNLPTGMLIANPANAATTCTGGILTAVPGTSVISYTTNYAPYSVASVPADWSCNVTVDVIAAAVGLLDNTTEDLTSGTEYLTSGYPSALSHGKATATLEVTFFELLLNKFFTDDPVAPGDTVTLDFVITNFNRSSAASNISFTDDLDAALSGLTAVGLPLVDPCGSGSQLTGTSVLTLTGGSLGPEASCAFSVTLQVPSAAPWGVYANTTSSVTGNIGGDGVTGNSATDYLIVQPVPVLTKSFADDPVAAGDTVTLQFTITNTSLDSSAAIFVFTDNLNAMLAGISVPWLPADGFCGAGSTIVTTTSILPFGELHLAMTGGNLAAEASCTFSVTLQLPADAPNGTYANTTSDIAATVGGVPLIGSPATDDLVVVGPPALSKSFTDDPVIPGDTVTLEFTLDHSEGAATATGIAFSDDLDAVLSGLTPVGLPLSDPCGSGSQLAGTTNLSFTGGSLAPGESCTFDVTLRVPAGAAAGNHTNTTSDVTATVGGVAVTGDSANDELKVAGLTLSKSFTDDPAIPGDTVTLQFVLSNTNPLSSVTNIAFTDDLSAVLSGLAAVGLPANDICGTGSQIDGTTNLSFSGGSLAPQTSCTFSVTLQVPITAPPGEYVNTTSLATADMDGTPVTVTPASDNLFVDEVLLLAKSFSDDPVAPGDTVALEFTAINRSSVSSTTDIAFTDDLNAALSGLVAVGLPATDVCGTGSQISGTNLLSFSGGNLAPGTSCTFDVSLQVPVSGSLGTFVNTTSEVEANMDGQAITASSATDELEVTTLGTIVIDKVTRPSGDPTSFDFALTGDPSMLNRQFSLADTSTPQSTLVLLGSGYSVTETVPAGWNLSSATCDDGSPVDNIDVSAGETVTCTFINSKPIYLPIVFKGATFAPDLVVQSIVATGNGVQVVIANQGNTPVSDDFWVDAYINPDPVPTAVNQIWNDLADEGLVWGVTADMQPGDVLTLTVGGAYYVADYSQVSWPLPAGTPIYAQVDSANADTIYGVVLESHEIRGEAYNNVAGPVYSSAAGSEAEPPAVWDALPAWYGDLPRRP